MLVRIKARTRIGALADEKLEGLNQLVALIGARLNSHRLIVALAGAPGAGKSTIASILRDRCVDELGASTEIVPAPTAASAKQAVASASGNS